jgi:hypothetical protein
VRKIPFVPGDEVAVAVAVARDFGVSVEDPVVLANGSNVLVWLRPAPVVARVATLTRLIRRPVSAWLARDIAVSSHVAARGVPVVRACVDPPPGPHRRDGQVLTFVEHVPHVRFMPGDSAVPAPASVGRALFELHSALDDYDGELPAGGPVDDLRALFDLVEREGLLTREVVAGLRADLEVLAARLSRFPVRALHGDSHPGNLLLTSSGLVWNDFEDTWRGPLGWDLACLQTSYLDGRAAVAAYPGLPPAEEMDVCLRLRLLFGVVWRYLLDDRLPGRAPDKHEHLARWLARDHGVLA